MTAAMIGTGILFFPVAPVFLFMRGKDVVIAKGTPVTSYVDGNTELDVAKFEVPTKTVEAAAAPGEGNKPPTESAPPLAETPAPPATATTPPPQK